jgi:DNA-binding CsgD family transcriptional regulator
MSWSYINLILVIISFAVGCMALCLAILFHLRKSYEWTKYYLVFQISITVLFVVYSLNMYITTEIHAPEAAEIVLRWLFFLDIAFMIYFIPFFSTWIIAHPWRNPYKTVFLLLGILFLVLAAVGTFIGYSIAVKVGMMVLFFGDFLFCLGVLLKNFRDIKDKDARMVSLACIILSLFMVPFIAADLVVTFSHLATMPVYYFWFSLIILVYLFNYFKRIPESARTEMDQEKLHQFHITFREQEIITLISEGLTSKEISSRLSISVSTVNNHIANIYQKTQVSSRIDLLNLLMC